jgi:uncharacterized membrane protein YqaE (UPF0057 family)
MAERSTGQTIALIICAFLLPPLAVGIVRGVGTSLVINIILSLLLWLPGFIHALLVIFKK